MKFLQVILLFSLVGCATEIDFYVPAQRFQTPKQMVPEESLTSVLVRQNPNKFLQQEYLTQFFLETM